MSRRKDRERFLRLKEQNPDYVGFRGRDTLTVSAPPQLVSVTCSVCSRKRNAPADTIPEDRDSYVCLTCQPEPDAAQVEAST